jgi:Uma2 family endonuclease
VELDVPPAVPMRRFTVEECSRMVEAGILREDERVELLEGWLVLMPQKQPPHEGTADVLQELLEAVLPEGWYARVQKALALGEGTQPEPDFAVVRGPRGQYKRRHPGPADVALVIEVSDATLSPDRNFKARVYARAGIPTYWIVNLINCRIEVHTDPTGPAEKPAYRKRQNYGLRTAVPVILDGREVGRVAVKEVFADLPA